MKKKLLLIFFVVLLVIFLILFINKTDNINEIVNNTIQNKDEYKITLTLKNVYYLNDEKVSSKIIYIEQKKNNLYKFTNKMYDNGTLKGENISYLENNDYYYKENGKYISKKVKNIKKVQDFSIDLKRFFNKVKKINRVKVEDKKYYKTKIKSEDAFSLIYENSKNDNLEKYTNVEIITNHNEIEEINFNVKDTYNNTYKVKMNLEYGLQDIELDVK